MAGTLYSPDRVPGIRAGLATAQGQHRGVEHELGVWLHTQRYKTRRGELDPAKAAALDERLPGWTSGRTRGRKPQGIPVADPGRPGLD
ncbi:helicase associated domain-containing protein [Arthrobacter rhizosphaerae]|uniref:helicase associated domain-containing protein n=1 Tax=Arthrobacter rhizosphaerae TaxID=2855490 RepID=UPI001FF45B7C|nr:helicase associated domain-containing protein [Arthrobacter rhizosphaerae]